MISTWSPPKALAWQKGLWVDLEKAWALAAGLHPAPTCKRTWDSDSGNRRDFQNGCPLCAAAVLSWWIQPHLAVKTWFVADRFTAFVTQPRRFAPLWHASWVPSVDRSRSSKSAVGFGTSMMKGLDGLARMML